MIPMRFSGSPLLSSIGGFFLCSISILAQAINCMKRMFDSIRPLALAGIATGTCISLLFVQILLLNEFASRLALTDKVFGLFRLTLGLIIFQGIFMALLILSLEWRMAKQHNAEKPSGEPPAAIPPITPPLGLGDR
jgi:uncharacterized membrane protein YiaA